MVTLEEFRSGQSYKYEKGKKFNPEIVFSKMGRCLVAAQRIEFVTGEILKFLVEFDEDLFGLTSAEFLQLASKSNKSKMTLGHIFRLLKLNPSLVIEEELNEYLYKGQYQTYTINKGIPF